MKLLALASICTLLAVVQGRALLEDGKPEGPSFKIINSTASLELRKYENATWAVAFGKSKWSVDLASFYAGQALVGYYKGANVAHTAIKPTVPLVATIFFPPHHKHGNGSHPFHHKRGLPAVALAGYLPSKFEGDPPIPDCPLVKILHTNETNVYVHKFGGWAFSFVVGHEIRHLALALKDIGICPFGGKFFVATYQGPFQLFGRRNEVMWVKKPSHHNETEEGGKLVSKSVGLGALDVELLFPEEFSVEEEPPFVAEGLKDDFRAAQQIALSKVEPAAKGDVAKMTQQSAVLDAIQIS